MLMFSPLFNVAGTGEVQQPTRAKDTAKQKKASAFSVVSSGFYVQSPTAECIVVGKKK
jgi:hypothetical protein